VTTGKAIRRHHVSLTEFAELTGRHRTTVQAWIRAGMPVKRARGGARGAHVIDPGPAFRWLLERTEAACEERIAALTANPDASLARARKLAAEADLAELERDRQRDHLLPVDDVEARWMQVAVAVREAVLAIAGVAVQAGIIRPDQEATLDDLCRSALLSLAPQGAPQTDLGGPL